MTADELLPIVAKAMKDANMSMPVGKLTDLTDAMHTRLVEAFPALHKARPRRFDGVLDAHATAVDL